MKKIVSICLAILMCSALFTGLTVSAATEVSAINVEWKLDKTTAAPGETVNLSFIVKNPENFDLGFYGLKNRLDIDANVFEAVKPEDLALSETTAASVVNHPTYFTAAKVVGNVIQFAFADETSDKSNPLMIGNDGVVFTVALKVKADVAVGTNATFTKGTSRYVNAHQMVAANTSSTGSLNLAAHDITVPTFTVAEPAPSFNWSTDTTMNSTSDLAHFAFDGAYLLTKNENMFNFAKVAKLYSDTATMSFNFNGTGFRIEGYQGAASGAFEVVVDGVSKATVDTASAEVKWFDNELYACNDLTAGDHSVVIKSTKNKSIYFDVVRVANGNENGTLLAAPVVDKIVRVEEPVSTTGAWSTKIFAGYSNGNVMITKELGATANYGDFNGPVSAINIGYVQYIQHGRFEVYVNGTKVKEVRSQSGIAGDYECKYDARATITADDLAAAGVDNSGTLNIELKYNKYCDGGIAVDFVEVVK